MEREIIRDEMVRVSAKLESTEGGLLLRREARNRLYRQMHGIPRPEDRPRRVQPVTPVKSSHPRAVPEVPTASQLAMEREESANAPPPIWVKEPKIDSKAAESRARPRESNEQPVRYPSRSRVPNEVTRALSNERNKATLDTALDTVASSPFPSMSDVRAEIERMSDADAAHGRSGNKGPSARASLQQRREVDFPLVTVGGVYQPPLHPREQAARENFPSETVHVDGAPYTPVTVGGVAYGPRKGSYYPPDLGMIEYSHGPGVPQVLLLTPGQVEEAAAEAPSPPS